MKKILVIVDMQNDFITGSLGSLECQCIVPAVVNKLKESLKNEDWIIFTRDTHNKDYLNTSEGKKLPVEHCIKGTPGHDIIPELWNEWCSIGVYNSYMHIFDKPIFGSLELMEALGKVEQIVKGEWEIEFCGVCTDICVVSNVLMAKSFYPDAKISVNPRLCAGTSINNHLSAIDVMRSCQIDIIETEEELVK